ncbi:MCE family protein [candidate division KSB1 bacterium]|nr:MCE family protein [candidate division KSB1 bacterium]RQW07978.1 MAG: MCE family protein [candidate division KSB1 bacterium]
MVTRSQHTRLGIFVTLALAALLLSIIVIVAPKILQDRDIYYIAFEDVSVTGLQEGSAVKYQGLQVGYISDIRIDPLNIRRVILKVSLDQGVPIKVDTRAEINFLGITGLKLIELRSGSQLAESLPPGAFIPAGRSLTDEITGKAEVLAEKAELILNNLIRASSDENADRVLALIDTVAHSMQILNQFIKANRDPFHATLQDAGLFIVELDSLTFYATSLLKSWDAFAKSDTLAQIVGNFAAVTEELKEAEVVQLFGEINTTLEQTNNILKDVEISFARSRTDLVYTIERLKETADYLHQFSRLVSEDPSIIVRGAEPKNAPDFDLER